MIIEDSFEVQAPRSIVWAALIDPLVMASCIPGCEAIEVVDDSHYRAHVKVKLGPISAKFALEVTVTEMTPPESILSTTKGQEGSRASTLSATSRLELEDLDSELTRVSYGSEVQLVGRLGRYGLGIMKKKAESLGKEFAAAFCERVAARVVA